MWCYYFLEIDNAHTKNGPVFSIVPFYFYFYCNYNDVFLILIYMGRFLVEGTSRSVCVYKFSGWNPCLIGTLIEAIYKTFESFLQALKEELPKTENGNIRSTLKSSFVVFL